jgi:hypothetical protein
VRCHFILKTIILPRQARDKHREKHSQKETRFSAGSEMLEVQKPMLIEAAKAFESAINQQ